jgi:hypothetical protein
MSGVVISRSQVEEILLLEVRNLSAVSQRDDSQQAKKSLLDTDLCATYSLLSLFASNVFSRASNYTNIVPRTLDGRSSTRSA